MEKGWKEVFLTSLDYQAAIAKGILEENGINAVIIDQHDSAYNSFGDIIVYVEDEFEARALELLKELKN